MMNSFTIKNYQKNNELYVDNLQSKLSDFQVKTILDISNKYNFSSFQSFAFLKVRKPGVISVTFSLTSGLMKKVFIHLSEVGSEFFLDVSPKFSSGESATVQLVDFGQGNTVGSDAYVYEPCVILSSVFDENVEKFSYKIRHDNREMEVYEHCIS